MKGKYPEYPVEPVSDIREMFLRNTERFAGRIALQYKKAESWIPILYRELREAVEETACGLAAAGLQPVENKIAI
jgi:long-subunit acyl-CoA synthetase (AMP-forming)